ncbi:MAG: hypothetical protein SAJ11_05475, partial [Jaaginema sp. PMC 1078.18]|nr:hypothetical protein [Jaaginema sp. PMC 1078.18]
MPIQKNTKIFKQCFPSAISFLLGIAARNPNLAGDTGKVSWGSIPWRGFRKTLKLLIFIKKLRLQLTQINIRRT